MPNPTKEARNIAPYVEYENKARIDTFPTELPVNIVRNRSTGRKTGDRLAVEAFIL